MRGVPLAGNLVPAELLPADSGHELPSCRPQLPCHTRRAPPPVFLGWHRSAQAEVSLTCESHRRTRVPGLPAPLPHSAPVHKAPTLVRKRPPVPLFSVNEFRCANLPESSGRRRF